MLGLLDLFSEDRPTWTVEEICNHLSLSQAIQLDMLVGARMQSAMDPTGDVDSYLDSQKGGPNLSYKRPDV